MSKAPKTKPGETVWNIRDGWTYNVVPGDSPNKAALGKRLESQGFRLLTDKDPERLAGNKWPAGTVIYGAGKKASAKYRKAKDEARAERRA
jgi:hypothetical protein